MSSPSPGRVTPLVEYTSRRTCSPRKTARPGPRAAIAQEMPYLWAASRATRRRGSLASRGSARELLHGAGRRLLHLDLRRGAVHDPESDGDGEEVLVASPGVARRQ